MRVAKTNSQAHQSPTDSVFSQIFLPGSRQKGALDFSQNLGGFAQQPAPLPGAGGVLVHGESLCSFPSSSSLLPSSWKNVYSFHQLLVGRDCRRFRSSVASILTAWRERKPHRCPQSQCPPPSFGMNPPLHAAGPPPVKTSCCLGGPQSAAPISAQPETCVLCKGTLNSFTPTINFSLVAACSTDKAQPISYCLPGFEDGITELQFCLSGIQGKKRRNENTMHFPVNCEGTQ